MPFSVTMIELEKGGINEGSGPARTYKRDNTLLWVIQGVLAALFLFAGGMKLTLPVAVLVGQSHLPGLLMRFVGVCEVLGALGLTLPGILRIRPALTSTAASGLVILMAAATVITVADGMTAAAPIPAVTGILCACVAYGRARVAPFNRSLIGS